MIRDKSRMIRDKVCGSINRVQSSGTRFVAVSTEYNHQGQETNNLLPTPVCVPGWSDGKIRAFTPLTGTSMFTIHNAHPLGVMVLQMTADCRRIVSGGKEGDVRIWSLHPNGTQNLDFILKEHKGAITDLKIHPNDRACLTTSVDGTCIIWDLGTYTRSQVVFTSNPLLCGCWGLEGLQVVAAGASRQLLYMEAYNGVVVRELEVSRCSPVTCLATSPDCCFLVTGSEDKLLKVWRYKEGEVVYLGVEHSAAVSGVAVAPDGRHLVSVGLDGAVLIWDFPQ
ncbi:WDR16 [Cordylochernes scorpioides]|uniref:WDR16 n=1 Tax=Cordylochernes scorpioides TaxID=51811 RepID=A0ABY6L7C6_9ARAC|nr:WDR16 [Cordylochernes scorpioides]